MMQGKKKAIEDIYQKMSPIEHILKRPDTYIGSTSKQIESMWVWDEGTMNMVNRNIEFVPGLFKIFDEVLVNAVDNYQRDQSMNQLKVTIDPEKNLISVWNNGQPIPIQIHKEHQMYVPELIFGVLLTGSNYDDSEKRVVGGRNGYGAKLANVYSKKFIVDIQDGGSGKVYKQIWTNNMGNKTIPEVNNSKSKENFVQVTFFPDLEKFGMQNLENDTVCLMMKRVYDMAGLYGGKLKVTLNGNLLKLNSFMKYVDLYISNQSDQIKIYDPQMTTSRWEVLVTYSPTQFQQVSFVNSICTSKGGSHVNYVMDKIVGEIQSELSTNKKYKGVEIQKYQIKQSLWVFINCLIDNPSFDSQTKENLTTKVSEFGGEAKDKFQVSEKFSKALMKTEIIESIVQQARAKLNSKMNKTLKGVKTSRLFGIEKLEDANEAGKRQSLECTLILTEGDSAKSLVMAAIDVIGRDRYGVYPLRGKLLNVRDASSQQILNNEEISNIIKIVGLQKDRQYEDLKSLRYGSIMFMADQDTDGSHIKGLLMNFFHHFWPSLIKFGGFLTEFVTPIIKVTKGNQQIQFFTIQDYSKWNQAQGGQEAKLWSTKYYKGLGTSDDDEAKQYFSNLRRHRLLFLYENEDDDKAIDLCFNKKKANERKEWLSGYDQDTYVDHNKKEIRYYDFVNREFIHYSMYDNIRSIPSIIDGLKPGQRKILFCCFKRNLRSELKVVQLGGYVAEHSAYHHGEASLSETIIGMAQNFPGSNNINLLLPKGQFGSRLAGGKDHASARYIFTLLNKQTRYLFPEADDHSLKYREDDGHIVEPDYYVPIIPMSLVNGADGIGTGWSTNVPNYNPRDVINQIRRKLNGSEIEHIHPWYRGWSGDIILNENGNYTVRGIWEWNEETSIVTIKEIPLKKWTKDYKEFLEKLVEDENSDICDYREYHTKHSVHFEIQLKQAVQFEKVFKLATSLSLSNMVLFNHQGKLTRYPSPKDIIEEFYMVRLEFYEKRKQYLASKLEREIQILNNKVRFILCVLSDEIKLRNMKKKDLCLQLVQKGFVKQSQLSKVRSTKLQVFEQQQKQNKKKNKESQDNNNDESQSDSDQQENPKNPRSQLDQIDIELNEYNYLLTMPLLSLTFEKVEKLKSELNEKKIALMETLENPIKNMWLNDLLAFEKVLDEAELAEQKGQSKSAQNAVKGKPMKKPKPEKQIANEQKIKDEGQIHDQKVKKKAAKETNQKKDENQSKQISQKPQKPLQQRRKKPLDDDSYQIENNNSDNQKEAIVRSRRQTNRKQIIESDDDKSENESDDQSD